MAADKETKKTKKHERKHPPDPRISTSRSAEALFKPSSTVKGIRFGGQFVVRSFTVRRAAPLDLLRLLDLPPPVPSCENGDGVDSAPTPVPFSSTAAYIPTSFTILAHQAWRTLTLGLGTNKSKILIFVFDSEASCSATADRLWPATIPLGEVNRRLIRWMTGCEMARFKFRKGALTFYVYAVRPTGVTGFARTDDLRALLESVDALGDFVDHTAMLAIPTRRSITMTPSRSPSRQAPAGQSGEQQQSKFTASR